MKKNNDKPLRLKLSVPLIVFLIFFSGCQVLPPEKPMVPTYPSLWESSDQDLQLALETALKKEFRGEYKGAIENKKADCGKRYTF